METIIGNSCEYKLIGDTMEELQLKSIKDNDIYTRSVFVAESDGRLLLEEGFVNYKEGDVIIVLSKYNSDEDKYVTRPVVIDNYHLADVIKDLSK